MLHQKSIGRPKLVPGDVNIEWTPGMKCLISHKATGTQTDLRKWENWQKIENWQYVMLHQKLIGRPKLVPVNVNTKWTPVIKCLISHKATGTQTDWRKWQNWQKIENWQYVMLHQKSIGRL